jgi:hypothetical protein
MTRTKSKKLDKAAIIKALMDKFKEIYIYPDVVPKMKSHLMKKLKRNDYDEFANISEFARQLMRDLREVSHDRHIAVYRVSRVDLQKKKTDAPTQQDIDRWTQLNFGFIEVRRLTGNIGYLRLDFFADPAYAGPTSTAAMNFLANSSAVIIDLRENHGGQETMVQYLLSYFFREDTHLRTFYNNKNEIVGQSWTHAYVPGKRMYDTDVYVLISNRTGSGAEAFSFDMKSFKRGTLIGETTLGAGHRVMAIDFPEFSIGANISFQRPANPKTGKGWEGVGVAPDVKVPDKDALKTAHKLAFKNILTKCRDKNLLEDLRWEKVAVAAEYSPITMTPKQMKQYTGEYNNGKYAILIKKDNLYYRFPGGSEDILIPLVKDLFGFDDTSDTRLQISRSKKGKVAGFRLVRRLFEDSVLYKRTGDI